MLSVLVVLLSRFSDDIRVESDLVWVRDRAVQKLLALSC